MFKNKLKAKVPLLASSPILMGAKAIRTGFGAAIAAKVSAAKKGVAALAGAMASSPVMQRLRELAPKPVDEPEASDGQSEIVETLLELADVGEVADEGMSADADEKDEPSYEEDFEDEEW